MDSCCCQRGCCGWYWSCGHLTRGNVPGNGSVRGTNSNNAVTNPICCIVEGCSIWVLFTIIQACTIIYIITTTHSSHCAGACFTVLCRKILSIGVLVSFIVITATLFPLHTLHCLLIEVRLCRRTVRIAAFQCWN